MEKKKIKVLERQYLVPFILITSCFAFWGFANDITNPMVKAFSRILMMSNFEGSLVQFAFYGGYFVMAFPAAMFIKRFTYKAGILMGLGLYATGALLFFPASLTAHFWPFLVAYFILTCGLSFLETSANPYILSMGSAATATRRLNLAQAFNPLGSLMGMFTVQQLILARLNMATAAERSQMDTDQLAVLTSSDLAIVRFPYIAIAVVITLMFVLIAITRMPKLQDADHKLHVGTTLKRLMKNKRYYEGVIAQFFYVGAQIMCWTFIIHYAAIELGMTEAEAQGYNIIAMIIGKYTKLPVGQLMIMVDSAIVIVGLFAFQDWKIPLYSLIVIFITGKVIDVVLEGANYDKVLLIVSDKTQEIRDKIINDVNRGGTLLYGEGLYSNVERKIVFTVVNRRETVMLQDYINKIDPSAFVTVINANEILGNGFKSLKEKVED